MIGRVRRAGNLCALWLMACREPGPPPDYVRYEVAPMTTAEQRSYVADALAEMRANEVALTEWSRRDPMCIHRHHDAVAALIEVAVASQVRFERAAAILDDAGAASEVHAVTRALADARTVAADAKGCAWLDPSPQPAFDPAHP